MYVGTKRSPSTSPNFQFDPNKPGSVIARQYIDSDVVIETFTLSRVKGICAMLPTTTLFPCYPGKLPINLLKLQDLKKLEQYIPAEH